MENLYICENGNLKENLQKLIENGYKYIIKANDKFLGGSFNPWGKKHIQLIASKTLEDTRIILEDLENDKTMNYIDWQYIENYKAIYNYTRNKSFTIKNDWTRCFK